MKDFKAKLSKVPKLPGCYQMKDHLGQIIYVGKAKNLSNRLKSYFTGKHNAKTSKLVENIDDFEYIITTTETEAFLLELNLIKKHHPKYNILLMDDKTYPYIYITDELHPRLILTRDPARFTKKAKGKLYGPYPNVLACKKTVEVLNKLFPLRKCKNINKQPCLYYSIGQCLAPCINDIKKDEYDQIISKINQFLTSSDSTLLKELEQKMYDASENMDFEKAIMYRDTIANIKELQTKQIITSNDLKNRDIFGFYESDGYINIQVFHMRFGKIIERNAKVFELFTNAYEYVQTYILQFYSMTSNILPQEILIPYIDNVEILESALNTKIIIPIKGDKKRLVDLACKNCQNTLLNKKLERLDVINKTTNTNKELGELLNINYPKRIEIFDNSHIHGNNLCSGMVVYIDGSKAKNEYRKYIIKNNEHFDDYHTMQTVIKRRYQKVLNEGLTKPNLIIVDGGMPQISACLNSLAELGIDDIYVCGLIKDDKHKTKAIMTKDFKEITINKHSNLFLYLEAMQDEVHRFVITFFRKSKQKTMSESILDNIKGIGKRRKNVLLSNFDSIEDIKNAKREHLLKLGIPSNIIDNIYNSLKE